LKNNDKSINSIVLLNDRNDVSYISIALCIYSLCGFATKMKKKQF